MQDEEIVGMYWLRNEKAIQETDRKYGRYLFKIAYNVLSDLEDSEESVNDTYLKAWQTMPPHRPNVLSAFLGKITRELAIDCYRKRTSLKRMGSEYALSLAELGDCVSDSGTPEEYLELKQLAEALGRFLETLSPEARNTFVGRYYYMDSIREVAAYYHMSESKAKSMLYRTRMSLRKFLEQEGYVP